MDKQDLKHTLGFASEEIRRLRRSNEIMNAQLHIVEIFEMALRHSMDKQSIGMGEDIAWKLDKLLAEVQIEIEATQSKPKPPLYKEEDQN